jgi:small-conductance mechanosensitive channel
MNMHIARDAGDVAQNVTQRSLTLVEETTRWIAGNLGGIVIAAVIGTLIALVLLGLRSLGCRLLKAKETGDVHWRTIFARALSKTNLAFIVLCAAVLVAEYANTPPALRRIIEFGFVISAAFQAAIWARELIIGFVEHRVGGDAEHSTLGSAVGIIRLLVSVALFAIAIILILDNLGVNVTGLVAGLGIGGIAIGLAAQGIFSDLFAALSIIFDKPFRRGDAVRFDDINGHVEQIGLKTTRVRSLNGEQIIVSNAKLLEKQLHNFTNLQQRRMAVKFGLIYQTAPEVLAQVPELLRGISEAKKNTRFIRCGFVGFGDSSLDFELVFDVRSSDYDFVFQTRSDICLEMLKAFNEAGIEFAYPTQTSFTAAPDGSLIMPYPDVRMVATEDLDELSTAPSDGGGQQPQG